MAHLYFAALPFSDFFRIPQRSGSSPSRVDILRSPVRPIAVARHQVGVGSRPDRERPEGIVVTVQRESNLLQIVRTLASPCRLASGLYRRQKQSDQDADDGNDHQEFDQRKAVTAPRRNATTTSSQVSFVSMSFAVPERSAAKRENEPPSPPRR